MKELISLSSVWLLLKVLSGLLVLFIIFKVSKLGVKIVTQKRRLLKPGIHLTKFLGFNPNKSMKKVLDAHGDAMYEIKEAVKKHPDAKAYLLQIGFGHLLALADPELIKAYNNRVTIDYNRPEANKSLIDPLLKNGLTTLTGEDWKLHRKILSDSFHFDIMERNIHDNHAATLEFFQNLSQQEMEGFYPREQLKRVFSAITGQTFFGENVDKRMIEGKSSLTYLMEIFEDLIQTARNPLILLPLPDFVRSRLIRSFGRFLQKSKKFKKLMLQIIQETRERLESHPHHKGGNIIEGLIEGQKQYKDRTSTLDDESIAGEFITLLFAGTDTTTMLLTITLYYLSLYPDLVNELREEVHRVIPDGKVTSISQLNNLELMHSTLKEVLRMHPPVGFIAKEAIRDTEVGDIHLKKGDFVGVAIQANNVNPKYWEDPEKFSPRRFMKGVISPHLEPFAFLTFSTGMRNCIGQHFAMMQAKLVLLTFITMFDFKLEPNYKLKMGFKILYEPMDPIKLILTKKTG